MHHRGIAYRNVVIRNAPSEYHAMQVPSLIIRSASRLRFHVRRSSSIFALKQIETNGEDVCDLLFSHTHFVVNKAVLLELVTEAK